MPLEVRKYKAWSALDYSTTDENLGVVFDAFRRAGIPRAWLPAAAHLMMETGNFARFTAAWNYGNLKYFGGSTRGASFLVNYNDDDPDDLFLGFDDPQTGIDAYVALVRSKYGIDGTETAAGYAQKLKAKGYATDPAFVQKVVAKYNSLTKSRPELLTWAGPVRPNTAGGWVLGVFTLLWMGSYIFKKKRA